MPEHFNLDELRLISVKVGFEQANVTIGGITAPIDGLMDRQLAFQIKEEFQEFILGLGAKYGFEVHARCVQL
jgi:hypothetical protein